VDDEPEESAGIEVVPASNNLDDEWPEEDVKPKAGKKGKKGGKKAQQDEDDEFDLDQEIAKNKAEQEAAAAAKKQAEAEAAAEAQDDGEQETGGGKVSGCSFAGGVCDMTDAQILSKKEKEKLKKEKEKVR
jgi:translation initiation factor 5B